MRGIRVLEMERKKSGVESGMIISSAGFVQRRLRVGGEMTFCSIKIQLFHFCSMVTLHLFLSRCVCVSYLRWGAGRSHLPRSLSSLLLARPWTWGCSEALGADEDRQGDTWEKKILQDVCTELSYLLEHRNSSSRTTDNVVMEITLTSVSGCLVSLLLCPPFLRCMWRSVRQLEEWFQDDMTKQQK